MAHDRRTTSGSMTNHAGAGLSLRARVVWGVLAVAVTLSAGLLSLVSGPATATAGGRSISNLPMLSSTVSPGSLEGVFQIPEIDHDRWTTIVIHHSGSPSGSAVTIDESHRAMGLNGLGYHFVIGNGRRMGDGEVHVGRRWIGQLPGAHVAGSAGRVLNLESIGICLVGDGDRDLFTEAQLSRLVDLISALCLELGIDRDRVLLHTEVASTTSPGRFFPASRLIEWRQSR